MKPRAICALVLITLFVPVSAQADDGRQTRVFLRESCVVSEGEETRAAAAAAIAAILLPKLIEAGLSALSTGIRKAGEKQEHHRTARLGFDLYLPTGGGDVQVNPEFSCILVVTGAFDADFDAPTPSPRFTGDSDSAAWLREHGIPLVADEEPALVYEATVERSSDGTGLRLRSQYLGVRALESRSGRRGSRGLAKGLMLEAPSSHDKRTTLTGALLDLGTAGSRKDDGYRVRRGRYSSYVDRARTSKRAEPFLQGAVSPVVPFPALSKESAQAHRAHKEIRDALEAEKATLQKALDERLCEEPACKEARTSRLGEIEKELRVRGISDAHRKALEAEQAAIRDVQARYGTRRLAEER